MRFLQARRRQVVARLLGHNFTAMTAKVFCLGVGFDQRSALFLFVWIYARRQQPLRPVPLRL